jgi:hypothetical protein
MSSVDVVVPCYNYARFLPNCVASVLQQSEVDVRVLIIDDCSGDDTELVGRTLAERDTRVQFRRHPANRGHIATYNEGLLEWASAPFSLLLSADDALTPGALARAVDLLIQHPEVGMTYGMALIVDENGQSNRPLSRMSKGYRILSRGDFLRFCCATGNPVPTPTAVVRTELQHRLGGYRANLPHTGDLEMWMRFALEAPVGVVHSVQAYYRRHNRNMSRQYFSQALSDSREVIDACEEVLAGRHAEFPESDLWLQAMYRHQGRRALWLASAALDRADLDGFHECLRVAEQMFPTVRRSAMWWRLHAKKLLGQSFWNGVRAALGPLRSGVEWATRRREPAPELFGRCPD